MASSFIPGEQIYDLLCCFSSPHFWHRPRRQDWPRQGCHHGEPGRQGLIGTWRVHIKVPYKSSSQPASFKNHPKTPPLNIWTYHHNIHLICSSKTFPCCRWVSDLCRHGCIENPYIICISSVYRHPYIIPIYSFHWPSPAGGGFLICAGAIALDVAEAWTKVGAESFGVPPEIRIKIQEHRDMRVIRPWVKLTLSNKWGIPEKIFEQRSNRRNETLIFWPVMVLCALEGVDTLTEVRLRFGNEASRKRITD